MSKKPSTVAERLTQHQQQKPVATISLTNTTETIVHNKIVSTKKLDETAPMPPQQPSNVPALSPPPTVTITQSSPMTMPLLTPPSPHPPPTPPSQPQTVSSATTTNVTTSTESTTTPPPTNTNPTMSEILSQNEDSRSSTTSTMSSSSSSSTMSTSSEAAETTTTTSTITESTNKRKLEETAEVSGVDVVKSSSNVELSSENNKTIDQPPPQTTTPTPTPIPPTKTEEAVAEMEVSCDESINAKKQKLDEANNITNTTETPTTPVVVKPMYVEPEHVNIGDYMCEWNNCHRFRPRFSNTKALNLYIFYFQVVN